MPKYNTALMSIDPSETRRYAGLNKAPNFNKKTILEACREVLYISEPQGIWEIYDYDAKNGIVLADTPFKLDGKKVTKHLCRATKVAIIAVTIGETVENEIARHFKDGEYTLAVLMDAAATTAVEQVADGIEHAIDQKIAMQGLVRRWRFSPGYGDWPIECQPEMLRLAKADEINLSLTSSFMLTPRKSITAIIGLIPKNEDTEPEKQSCKFCPNPNCNFRIKEFDPEAFKAQQNL